MYVCEMCAIIMQQQRKKKLFAKYVLMKNLGKICFNIARSSNGDNEKDKIKTVKRNLITAKNEKY